jgi:hypothetical protein
VSSRDIAPFACLLVVTTVAACGQFRVRTRHDPNVDFARLHTYAWLPRSEAEPADQRVLDRAVDARIRARVDADLRAKGFAPSGDAPPDFFLNYRLASSPDSAAGGPGPYAWGGWWAAWNGAEGIYRESFDVGALYLAVDDPATKRIIWLGAAEARLVPHISHERRMKRVDSAVDQILEGFPPRPER